MKKKSGIDKVEEVLSKHKSLTLENIVKLTRLSRSNVSAYLSILNSRGLIQKIKPPAIYRIKEK